MYTILVVDDTLFNRKLMLEVLETKIDNARYLPRDALRTCRGTDGRQGVDPPSSTTGPPNGSTDIPRPLAKKT